MKHKNNKHNDPLDFVEHSSLDTIHEHAQLLHASHIRKYIKQHGD